MLYKWFEVYGLIYLDNYCVNETNLRGGDSELLEPVSEPLALAVELLVLLPQDLHVQVDQLQERLGRRVVVP